MKHQIRKTTLALLATTAVFASTLTSQAEDLPKVKYQLHFAPSALELPIFYAYEKGYFTEEGIDLEIIPGKSSQDAVNALISGSAFIASSQGSSVMQGASKGQEVVMVGSRYGENPSGLFADKSITEVAGLTDKQIAVPFSTLEKIVRYVIGKSGADPDSNEYILVPQLSAMVNTFAEGKVDSVITTVPFGKGIIKDRREFNLFLLSENGVTDPGYVFATTQTALDEHPEQVRAFLKAAYRGYADVANNMDEAAKITSEWMQGADLDFVKNYYAAYDVFACTDEQKGKSRGFLPVENLQTALDLFVETGIIENAVSADQMSTNRFFEGSDAIEITAKCE
ncbi:ABC transporter substrate-binding protein [Pseudooceanicola sp. MF1-13]|uniref:ABC transporter substrate-binding protein n=1 Tax=Pseudooceanicola sp. MF1-13 TaxID=3379095 RepID=UPI003892023C